MTKGVRRAAPRRTAVDRGYQLAWWEPIRDEHRELSTSLATCIFLLYSCISLMDPWYIFPREEFPKARARAPSAEAAMWCASR